MMLGTQVLFKTHFYISSSAVEQSHTQPVHICLKASLFAMSMSLSGFASPKGLLFVLLTGHPSNSEVVQTGSRAFEVCLSLGFYCAI